MSCITIRGRSKSFRTCSLQVYSTCTCFNLLIASQSRFNLLQHALSTVIQINNIMESLIAILIKDLSFVKNNVTRNMIIMRIDRKNNDLLFFQPYIKLSQATYVTNDIS